MNGLNLSQWALRHRAMVVYFMLAVAAAGVISYVRLGRSEDPSFTVKLMVIQARWPGATIDDTIKQVTERIERKAQETPNLDYVSSYTKPGESTVFVALKGSTLPRDVPDAWYQVRKKIGDIRSDLPQGVQGPAFNDEFGDTYGILYAFTADGFSQRELRDYVEDVRSRLLQTPDVSKIDVVGAQDERVFVEYSTSKLAGLGINPTAIIAALQAQNAVTPAGVVQTGDEQLLVRVSGAFRSERDLLDVNLLADGKLIRLGDFADVRRGYADPPQPMFHVNGKPAIALAIAMREGGDVLQLG
jgi:multidrug efflux pump subunit AcrB